MSKPVTSVKEIIAGIKAGIMAVDSPTRDTGEEQPVQRERKSSQSEQDRLPKA